jgi:hypothetical protein
LIESFAASGVGFAEGSYTLIVVVGDSLQAIVAFLVYVGGSYRAGCGRKRKGEQHQAKDERCGKVSEKSPHRSLLLRFEWGEGLAEIQCSYLIFNWKSIIIGPQGERDINGIR